MNKNHKLIMYTECTAPGSLEVFNSVKEGLSSLYVENFTYILRILTKP